MVHYLQYKSWSIVSYRRQKGRHLEMRAYEHAVRDVTGETLDKFWDRLKSVSYTHLTLPTICSV